MIFNYWNENIPDPLPESYESWTREEIEQASEEYPEAQEEYPDERDEHDSPDSIDDILD